MQNEPLTIEERVQRMEDLEEIRHLFTAYAQYLDHADYDAYAELFALSGELDLGPAGQATGRAAIRALIEKLVRHRTAPVRHIISSPVIRLNGGSATASVMWTMLSCSSDGRPAIGMVGHHEDILIKEDGVWKFQRLEGRVDIGSLPQRQEQ
jgi:SnoaL-like domain